MQFLNFDNSDFGCIDEYISEKIYNEKNKLYKVKLNIQNDIILNVVKYKNAFPLIISDVKKYFKIPRVYYNIVTINGVKYLAYENLNNISFKDYTKNINLKNEKFLRYQLQDIFAFNWLMCINSNYENNICVFPNTYTPFVIDTKNSKNILFKSVNEKSFKFNTYNHEISKNILDKWFNGSLEEFQSVVKSLVNELDPDNLRIEITKIVNKYDNNFVSWINPIFENISTSKEIFQN